MKRVKEARRRVNTSATPDPAIATAPPTVSDTASMLTSDCGAARPSELVLAELVPVVVLTRSLTATSAMATGAAPSSAAPAISPQATIRIATSSELALDRLERGPHALGGCGQETDERHHEHRGVEIVGGVGACHSFDHDNYPNQSIINPRHETT